MRNRIRHNGQLTDEALELPRAAAKGFRVEIDSSGETLIDGSCSLKEYDEARISVICGGRKVILTGDGLCIAEFTPDRFVVTGLITGVELE